MTIISVGSSYDCPGCKANSRVPGLQKSSRKASVAKAREGCAVLPECAGVFSHACVFVIVPVRTDCGCEELPASLEGSVEGSVPAHCPCLESLRLS